MDEVSIVIPTYNEGENIKKLIPRIEEILKKEDIIGEIIIIDDNSPDGTGNIVEGLSKQYKNIKVVHRKKKEGVGSARKLGFSIASKEVIISMEGDNTHDPIYIPLLMKKIKDGVDLVIGSRYLKDSEIINWPLKRRLISKIANIIARVFSKTKIKDVTSGYRAFRKSMYKRLLIDSYGYPFNMEFACEAWTRGFKVEEIPISFINRKKGKSKMHVLKECLSFIYAAFRFSYLYRPVMVFGGAGLILFIIGIILGIQVIHLKLTGNIANRITLIFLSVLLILFGFQMMSIGLIAGILTKLRKEVL